MKYEMSQQDYVDFLNSLTYTQQATRTAIAPNSTVGTYINGTTNNVRNKIKISSSGVATTTPAIYVTDYPNVACNFLSWEDVASYLDWSGLRPMTELEFEKACRGTLSPVANEYAWGTTGIAGSAYTLSNPGAINEVIATNYSSTNGNVAYTLTIPLAGSIIGPLRAGIFAGTPGNTGRVTAGATYYGIMEMSGNVWERPVTVGNPTGRTFTGTHGNGIIDATGNADASAWPGADAIGAGARGGTWSNSASNLRVSDRLFAANTNTGRSANYGGRGVRLAPPSYFIGQSYGGGIIFYIDGTGQHGLISAPTDQATALWGCNNNFIGGTSTDIGTGDANTATIVSGCSESGIAASICKNLVLNGYDDWFLPSKDELVQLYIQKNVIGGFVSFYYWSSSDVSTTQAWCFIFGLGIPTWGNKIDNFGVRPVRTF
jgi:formylglycine-generating enzyme required for sulfatase activity